MLREFKEFINRGNVIDLAVAVVLGAAFAKIVSAFTTFILMPIIGIFGGKPSFDDYYLTINNSQIKWGAFLSVVVEFVIIAFAIFLVVKAINRLQNLRKSKEEMEEAELTEVDVLTEIRDLLAAQQQAR